MKDLGGMRSAPASQREAAAPGGDEAAPGAAPRLLPSLRDLTDTVRGALGELGVETPDPNELLSPGLRERLPGGLGRGLSLP
jgi:hypothetical protein